MRNEKEYKATVRIVVDIEVSGVWGEECTMKQVHKQAISEAEQTLGNLLSNIPAVQKSAATKIKPGHLIRVVIEPKT